MRNYLRYTLGLIALLFVIISIPLIIPSISAQGGGGAGGGGSGRNDTNYTAYFDPEIEEEFDVKDHVVIMVDLYTPNASKVDEILANLTPGEFNLSGKVGGFGFGGNATESAFDKLVHNTDVKAVYWGGWNSFIQENITGGDKQVDKTIDVERLSNKFISVPLLFISAVIVILLFILFLKRDQNGK